MSKPYKVTTTELHTAVSEFLNLCERSMQEAQETKETAKLVPATRASFIQWCQSSDKEYLHCIFATDLANWNQAEEEDKIKQIYAQEVQRIDAAGAKYYETLALINPKLTQLAQLGLKQSNYGAYSEKPDSSISISIANKGSKVNWGT